MAKRKLTLSQEARDDRKYILVYWKRRNQSSSFSRKLNSLFEETFASIRQHPESGQLIGEGVRSKIVNTYRVVYQIFPTEIVILRIKNSSEGPLRLDF